MTRLVFAALAMTVALAAGADPLLETESERTPAALAQGVVVTRDIAYGSDPRQRFDVYRSGGQTAAPVIFLVHGGGWRTGDKAMRTVVENKVARWVPRGFIVVSVNYRLLPQAAPLEQAADLAQALALVQQRAAGWGGDARKVILMGHSAGAHLVALMAASGRSGWLGTVALDSAAFDVERIMTGRHLGLYDQAFGADPAVWRAVSPYHVLAGPARPLLAVCSTRRAAACGQAHAFAARAATLGMQVQVLPQDRSHRDINHELGLDGAYTDAVERFMRALL